MVYGHPNIPCLICLCYEISKLTEWSHMLTKTLEMLTKLGFKLTKAETLPRSCLPLLWSLKA